MENKIILKKKEIMMPSVFELVNEDILQHILSRLPALSFASATRINKSWNKVCNRVLFKPKLASALSLSPSLPVAVTEVIDKVLSKPIRPNFAIVSVGLRAKLADAHQLITARLRARTSDITIAVTGIIGLDAVLDEPCEALLEENLHNDFDHCSGVLLVVGYVPGLKVDSIPLLRSKKGKNIDTRPIPAEIDYGLPEETVRVCDATSCFLFKSVENSQN